MRRLLLRLGRGGCALRLRAIPVRLVPHHCLVACSLTSRTDPSWTPYTRAKPSWLAFDRAGKVSNEDLSWFEKEKFELVFAGHEKSEGEEFLGESNE